MVAIVSGIGAGLELSSRAVLGQAGMTGNASEGRNGQSVFVNVSTGGLIIQNQDEYLAARGADHSVLRTYNSNGALDDDNGDQWRADQLTLKLYGAVNAAGSSLYRYDRDGSAACYTFDSARGLYVSGEGAGAFDTIAYIAGAGQFEFRDGGSGATERFEGSGAFRILSRADTSGNTLSFGYGASGLLESVSTSSGETVYYDYAGNNLAQVRTVAGGATTTRVRYVYDYFGRLTSHVNLGGASHTYVYDNARQLTTQTNSQGQSLAYGYDAAGQVTTITDWANGKTTNYLYDLSGRRIRERVVQGGNTYQDNHLAYDAQGKLRDVADARVHIAMEYDKSGNRTRVTSRVNYQGTSGETTQESDRYFLFDEMNRQKVVDAVDAAGNRGTQGHLIKYDLNGNRVSDEFWGNKVTASTKTITGYDDEGRAILNLSGVVYSSSLGYTTEEYRYDALNRLQGVERDGTQIDVRLYDGADRVVQSGPASGLPLQYTEELNKNLAPGESNGKETRINRYDANGRLLHQKVLKSDGSAKADISWDVGEVHVVQTARITESGITYDTQYYGADGYDQAGNSVGYTVQSHETGAISEYTTSLAKHEGYQAAFTSGVSTKQNPGSTTQEYDANGFLSRITDSAQSLNDRSFVNDVQGRALYVNQGGNVQRQLIANGEVLGLYGVGVNPKDPYSGNNNNPNFANIVDFDFGYAKITSTYPAPAPGAYQVNVGDTLQSIAQAAYGDGALWYRIAEANGLASSKDLKVGQTLNIPSRVATINNNNETFKPYDPSRITGDLTPTLTTPADSNGCGAVGKLVMVVIAIVVSFVTAGVMSGFVGTFMETLVAGAEALAGSLAAGASLASFQAMATASAVGSVASQIAGMGMGNIEKFSWRGVAASALGAGLSTALPVSVPGLGLTGVAVARGALGNALSQGIGIAVGLQKKFSWTAVAASAAAAAAATNLGKALGLPASGAKPTEMQWGEFFGKTLSKSLVSSFLGALGRSGRSSLDDIAADAFGNAFARNLAAGDLQAPAMANRFPDATDYGEHIVNAPAKTSLSTAAFLNVFAQERGPDRSQDVTLAAGAGYEPGALVPGEERSARERLAQTDAGDKQSRTVPVVANSAFASGNGSARNNVTPAYLPGVGYADENRVFPTVRVAPAPEADLLLDVLDEVAGRTAGTVLGVASIAHGAAQFVSDQFWVFAGTVTGGSLYDNLGSARAAAARNVARSKAIVEFPSQAAPIALRAITGNWHGAGQALMNALHVDEIRQLNGRGDYLGAQILATQQALHLASFAAGGAGPLRSTVGTAKSTTLAALEASSAGAELAFRAGPVPYGSPYSQLSSSARTSLLEKVQRRIITREEWARLQWNERIVSRRQAGIDAFWDGERQALTRGFRGSRDWSPEAVQAILDGGRPPGIFSHHRYSVSLYPQLANDGSLIVPVTFFEHFHKWHGGSWFNPSHGVPLKPNIPDHF